MPTGRFITLEGGEGAGKTTQVRRLASWLQSRGIDVVTTREPGGSPGAEQIRQLLVEGDAGRWGPVTEALLHTAARRDHLERMVWPAIECGQWVICDRFFDSTMAYQGYGQKLGRPFVTALQDLALGDFRPDLTLILDLPVETGLARANARRGTENRYESMAVAFHHALRMGFQDIAIRDPARCVLIDAMRSVDEVELAMRTAVCEKLGVDRP